MDYKEKYIAALERAKEYHDDGGAPLILEVIFPELKESEDELIRKAIKSGIKHLETQLGYDVVDGVDILNIYSWLEKQEVPKDKGEISDGYHTFNELYKYRLLYNAAFFNLLPKELVHKSKRHHNGEECFGGGWFIVMANLPTGQISNHYELKDWDLFQIPEKDVADEWDGHTPQEAAERLYKFLLEKQSEQKPIDYNEELKKCRENPLYFFDKYVSVKLKKQKLAWSKEDEQSKNWILEYLYDGLRRTDEQFKDEFKAAIDWLEKQGEQNFDYEHADIPQKDFALIEPKFKVRDWLQYRNAEPFLVEEITEQGYCNGDCCLPFEWEDEIHLWDIQDAEDGDVLVDVYGNIGIFKKCYDFDWISYCSLGNNGGFQVFTVEHENEKTYPATKEQCKLLFQKMKEDGWEWDAEKKELKTYRTI